MSAVLALTVGGPPMWLLRVAFITLLPADRLPAGIARALRHVGPSARRCWS